MGQIVDVASIGGSGHGKIWDSRSIGSDEQSPPIPIAITSYRLAYKTSQEHTFSYPDEMLTTVFEGALMYINPPPGIVLPMTVTSSNPEIAEAGAGAIITWHNAGSVTLTVTDTLGNSAVATFSPRYFFVPAGENVSHSEALDNCTALGGVAPDITLLTNSTDGAMSGERKIGTLWGEWGDPRMSGWPDLGTSTQMWALYANENDIADSMLLSNGSKKGTTGSITNEMLGICQLDAAPPSLSLDQYTTSPGTSEAHTFSFSTDGSIKTIWEGAKVQLVIPDNAISPITCSSSDTAIAETDNTGLVTWHAAGPVTFTLTDSTNRQGAITLSPVLFFVPNPDSVRYNYSEVGVYLASLSQRLPTSDEVTIGVGVRGVGSLYSEWGSFDLNGSEWLGLNSVGKYFHYWTSTPSPEGHYIVYIESDDGGGNGRGKLMTASDDVPTCPLGIKL
ncbi:Ig-like domain-containing protein [Lelliottia wanjuensis]|uniref:hypothetical protein n=1 Tax=Lelliottia wanjuensis TaxID=3050585 RepID=UPI00254A64A0|nr:hypothetical protein [Lelliottia sp. V104_15]MDK9607125.1 hypothetical protein [Lelliottia sp. V104_15]